MCATDSWNSSAAPSSATWLAWRAAACTARRRKSTCLTRSFHGTARCVVVAGTGEPRRRRVTCESVTPPAAACTRFSELCTGEIRTSLFADNSAINVQRLATSVQDTELWYGGGLRLGVHRCEGDAPANRCSCSLTSPCTCGTATPSPLGSWKQTCFACATRWLSTTLASKAVRRRRLCTACCHVTAVCYPRKQVPASSSRIRATTCCELAVTCGRRWRSPRPSSRATSLQHPPAVNS